MGQKPPAETVGERDRERYEEGVGLRFREIDLDIFNISMYGWLKALNSKMDIEREREGGRKRKRERALHQSLA